MGVEVGPAVAIAAMALVSYALRVSGPFLMRWMPITRRVERGLDALAGSVLVAIVAPAALSGDLALRLGVATAIGVTLASRNSVLALGLGLGVAALTRAAG